MIFATDFVDQLNGCATWFHSSNKLFDLGLERRLRRKVGDAKTLPLKNRKPLLDLIHPRAMDRGEMEDKAGMALQPLADFLAMMR